MTEQFQLFSKTNVTPGNFELSQRSTIRHTMKKNKNWMNDFPLRLNLKRDKSEIDWKDFICQPRKFGRRKKLNFKEKC